MFQCSTCMAALSLQAFPPVDLLVRILSAESSHQEPIVVQRRDSEAMHPSDPWGMQWYQERVSACQLTITPATSLVSRAWYAATVLARVEELKQHSARLLGSLPGVMGWSRMNPFADEDNCHGTTPCHALHHALYRTMPYSPPCPTL